MTDKILEGFLRCQDREGRALAQESPLLELQPDGEDPPRRYLAHLLGRGLVYEADGNVREADRFAVGIRFPDDYLRRADPYEILTWLGPPNVFHPNIRPPFICVGRVLPGMPLVDLLYQVHEIITFQKVTMREDDALNRTACVWARRNQGRFPIDRRPLKGRRLHLQVSVSAQASAPAEGATG